MAMRVYIQAPATQTATRQEAWWY